MTELPKGQPIELRWIAPMGARQTCSVSVFYSTNNQATWTKIAGPVKYNYGNEPNPDGKLTWTVPAVETQNCYLKIEAHDNAENFHRLISQRFTILCPKPTAEFVIGAAIGYHTVGFTDQSTGSPTSWNWDFGDGHTATFQGGLHTYAAPGNYNVRLISTNDCGPDTVFHTAVIRACQPGDWDSDGDGACDGWDNCVTLWNPGQEDGNMDGEGDACCCHSPSGNADKDPNEEVDGSDLQVLIDYIFFGVIPLPCPGEANVDGILVGGLPVDPSDLNYMVEFMFLEGPPPVNCVY